MVFCKKRDHAAQTSYRIRARAFNRDQCVQFKRRSIVGTGEIRINSNERGSGLLRRHARIPIDILPQSDYTVQSAHAKMAFCRHLLFCVVDIELDPTFKLIDQVDNILLIDTVVDWLLCGFLIKRDLMQIGIVQQHLKRPDLTG